MPNAVSLLLGDNMRRAIPWVAILGGVFVLACDIVGRLLIHPYEIPWARSSAWSAARCSCGCCTDGGTVMPEARAAIAAPRPPRAVAQRASPQARRLWLLAASAAACIAAFMTLGAQGGWSFILPFRGGKLLAMLAVAMRWRCPRCCSRPSRTTAS